MLGGGKWCFQVWQKVSMTSMAMRVAGGGQTGSIAAEILQGHAWGCWEGVGMVACQFECNACFCRLAEHARVQLRLGERHLLQTF